jgi:hypothetical protein
MKLVNGGYSQLMNRFIFTIHADLLFFRDMAARYLANKTAVDAWSGTVVTAAVQWDDVRLT